MPKLTPAQIEPAGQMQIALIAARQQPKILGINWLWMQSILTLALVQYLGWLMGDAPGLVAWVLSIVLPALLVMVLSKREGMLSGRGWLVVLSIASVVGAAVVAALAGGV